MPIIKSKKRIDTFSIKGKIDPQILEQIEAYCHWAGVYDFGYFIEKASKLLLSQDEEWLFHNKMKAEEEVAG